MSCGVCGSECEVERDAPGATCWAESFGKPSFKHDRFFCPCSGEEWHREALPLVWEIRKCPSQRMRDLMQKDLEEVLARGGLPDSAKGENGEAS
jgi:hypothetical protein